ncbi:hypothetical protein CYMTET_30925 [Cymbomonas tetramitiformis]|uniref:Uncharacterized protein n=1 Tax=Cymbomonas tetramitiformis TaxID=36881 RepID=A0AAE0KTQ0_9CHLO|nr:hypothetical protein CYMTET_30925 [Cymbomonas tetramitiformis]
MDANEDERAEECRQAREKEELQDVHGEDGEGGEGGEHPASAEADVEQACSQEIARIVAAAEELFGGEEVLKHYFFCAGHA